MTSTEFQAYVRRFLLWGSGMLVTYGVVAPGATWVTPTIGVLTTVAAFGWSIYGGRLNGLLAQIQGKDGVEAVKIEVDPDKIDAVAVTANTVPGVSAIPAK